MMTYMRSLIVLFSLASCLLPVMAQSSSLYVTEGQRAAPLPTVTAGSTLDQLSPEVVSLSLSAVQLPEPRKFAVHDLVTIVVRESVQNNSTTKIDADKEVELTGGIEAFPSLRLKNLLQFQLGASDFNRGRPGLDLQLENQFQGKGTYNRRDTFITRITAEIIDIKPNGNLVLEARKHIQSDDESMTLSLTGSCRTVDIGADNAVLSTDLFDLRLVKRHEGELRKTTKKGLLTKLFEAIFNF